MVIESFEVGSEIQFGTADVNSLCFNGTGSLLAVCTSDKKINLLGVNSSGLTYDPLPVSPLNSGGEHHSYAVSCCTFSCLGAHLATCGMDGSLIVWDLLDVSNPTVFFKYQAGQFKCCRFSPSANVPLLAAGDADGLVHLYDMVERRVRHKLKGHQGQITGLAFSPDGLWLMAGSSGMGTGDLWLWSTNLPHQLLEVSSARATDVDSSAHEMGVYCIQFSPTFSDGNSDSGNGLLLATGGGDNLVKLWTILPHARQNCRIKLRCKLEYHTYMVTDCGFSSDGCFLCTVSVDKRVLIWNPLNAQLLQVLERHQRFISSCSWNPFPNRARRNARVLATGGNDKNVIMWHLFVRGESDMECGLPENTSWDLPERGFGQESNIPSEFFCPIAQEVMRDPVVASDGYSYERESLHKWFLSRHTSPMTNLPLTSLQLIPNRNLKTLIHAHMEKQNQTKQENETPK